MISTVAGFVYGGVLLGLSVLGAEPATEHTCRWPSYVAGQLAMWRRLSRHA
jgi:hypothetical protein